MDWGSLIGLLIALGGIIAGQLLEGGHLGSLVQPAALMIVMMGTTGAVLLQSGLGNFIRGVAMAKWVFFPLEDNRHVMADDIELWSMIVRREGMLSLERYQNAAHDPFTAKGLRLVIDGVDPVKIREILDIEISSYESKERHAIKIWEAAGGYAPTVGILGAVLGLIHVMENLTDPARLGTGIAVAFVATIYGVGLANLVFLPIAHRLKSLVNRQISRMDMLTDAFYGIATGDNSMVIDERIAGYLR